MSKKDLSNEEATKKSKKQELTEAQKERIKINTLQDNILYDTEYEGVQRNLTEEQIEKQIKEVKDYLQNEIEDTPIYILEDDYFILVLAIFTCNNPYCNLQDIATENKELIERYGWYTDVMDFFKDPKAYEILEIYGKPIKKDNEGYYKLDETIVNKVVRDSGFYISDKDGLKAMQNAIFDTWENQKEILTDDSLNNYSKERNGINFKYFIFCEEYIKRGKIKPTCDYLGISRNTAYLWLEKDEVKKYLEDRQNEIKKETDDTFIQTYRDSFNELNRMIKSSYIDTSDKIKAIDTFLKHYENIERLKQPLTTYED